MASRRLLALAGVVLALAIAMIVYEDILLFLEATGTLPAGFADSPFLLVAIPFTLAVTLVLVLFGAALLNAETLR
ncbi:MAG: hypothetical protein V5A33_04815 [Halobacteriales archaeon]